MNAIYFKGESHLSYCIIAMQTSISFTFIVHSYDSMIIRSYEFNLKIIVQSLPAIRAIAR